MARHGLNHARAVVLSAHSAFPLLSVRWRFRRVRRGFTHPLRGIVKRVRSYASRPAFGARSTTGRLGYAAHAYPHNRVCHLVRCRLAAMPKIPHVACRDAGAAAAVALSSAPCAGLGASSRVCAAVLRVPASMVRYSSRELCELRCTRRWTHTNARLFLEGPRDHRTASRRLCERLRRHVRGHRPRRPASRRRRVRPRRGQQAQRRRGEAATRRGGELSRAVRGKPAGAERRVLAARVRVQRRTCGPAAERLPDRRGDQPVQR
ncbi:hypothetical protein ERJ75_000437600 [Trypanosoma vivax]|nr:hypothetical protein ERJ75_000437600 [Trypanosoma vivax]